MALGLLTRSNRWRSEPRQEAAWRSINGDAGLVLALGAGSRLNDNVHARSRYSWLLHCPYRQLRNRITLEKLFDEAAGCETVVGDVYVVLARFAYHIGHLDIIRDTIKPPRLQLDEGVHVAFFGWGRHTVEQEVSMDG